MGLLAKCRALQKACVIILTMWAWEKGVTKCDTLGGKQELTVINESGLYSLILGSKLPTAKQFKRWITAEVIPSIRKTGSYSVKQKSSVPKLGEVNAAARIISKTLKEAGMPPQYRAVAIQSLIPVSLATLYADNPFCFISSSKISYIICAPFTNRKILSKCYWLLSKSEV